MSLAAAPSAVRTGTVLADLLPAATVSRARVRDAALVVGGAVLTGIAGFIKNSMGGPAPS